MESNLLLSFSKRRAHVITAVLLVLFAAWKANFTGVGVEVHGPSGEQHVWLIAVKEEYHHYACPTEGGMVWHVLGIQADMFELIDNRGAFLGKLHNL